MAGQLIIAHEKKKIIQKLSYFLRNYIDLQNYQTIRQKIMANHKSAKKRSRQNIKKNEIKQSGFI